MNTQSQALRLADVLTEEGDSWWDEQAATELRRLDQLAMDQHTEIYGLRLQVRNLLYALKYHQEQTRPIQRTIDAIAKAEAV
jgi:hypothetical protein